MNVSRISSFVYVVFPLFYVMHYDQGWWLLSHTSELNSRPSSKWLQCLLKTWTETSPEEDESILS